MRKLLATAAIAAIMAGGCAADSNRARPSGRDHQPTVDCQEDQACWDCGSMGNMVCGTWEDAKASADRCRGYVYFHQDGVYTTVCPT